MIVQPHIDRLRKVTAPRQCRLFVLAASLFACGPAMTESLNVHHYGVSDGLPQTQVRAIHQDATGFLWVGTYGGLGRYDGRAFTAFTTAEGLTSNNISAISSTRDGTIWAGTTRGACFMPRGADMFHCLEDASLASAHITALLPANDGGMWIGAESGLFRIDAEARVRRFDISPQPLAVTSLAMSAGGLWVGTQRGLLRVVDGELVESMHAQLEQRHIKSLLPDGERLWIGAVGGLYLLEKDTVTPAPGLPDDWMQDDINALARGRDGTIWAATDQGVLWQDDGRFDLLTTQDGLMSSITFAVLVDREGIVWLGNDDGVSKYVPGPFVGYTEAHGLLHYFVRTINEDSRHRLWFGTRTGVQIVPHVDGEPDFSRDITITADDGLSDERIYSIAFPAPGEAYLATGNGVVHWREGRGIVNVIDREDGLPVDATQALKLQGDRLWIGTNLGVRYIDDRTVHAPASPELASAYVYRIQEDTQGRLWFGSQDKGLFVVEPDGATRQFGAADGLSDETLWDVAPDAEGGVWVGSNGDGLFHIDSRGDITRYTTADGLVDNFIWQVLVDRDGNIWTYTNRGISRFDGTHFRSYTEADGLLHPEGGATGAWQSSSGQLWFASANGLMRYDPAREYVNRVPPAVVIQEVLAGDRLIAQDTYLPYQGESLNFQYAALSFQSEAQVRFKYRLRGADNNWSDPVPYRPITYANLGAGHYDFEVLARNPDGVWSTKPARFHFHVLPPYWATAWFWALVVAGLVLLLWCAYRLRVRHMEARRRSLEALVAKRTTELESANEQLKAASLIDPLTGLHNRRFLVGQISTDIAQARRAYRGPSQYPNRDVVFMMVDIDNFKEVNDIHGHIAGDRVLRQYAQLLRSQIRESDYVVRWGGEEFLIVARQAESAQSNVIAQRIIDTARATRFEIDDEGATVECTCSIGVSHFPFRPQHPDAFTWEQIVDIADMAVYMAKANGRNGWVALHAAPDMDITDGAGAVRRFRENMKQCIDSGELVVRSSFDELEATLIERRHRRGTR